MNGCVLLSLCALAGQAPAGASDALDFDRLATQRDLLERRHASMPTDAATALRLVAAQVLGGEYQAATRLASSLFARGALAARDATRRARGEVGRIFTALVATPADMAAATKLLESAPGPGDPGGGDIAWPFARAFALARAGESHAAATALERLAQRLRDGAGLQVATFAFATRVTSFGSYESDTRTSFRPGDSVLVYAEPRGFRSTSIPSADDGHARWRVRLRLGVTLHDLVGGKRAGAWGPDDVTHVTRSQVNDLHVTRLVRLPADLAPGAYELRLELEDVTDPPRTGLAIKRLTVTK